MMNKTKLLSFEKHPVFCPPVSTDGKVAKKNSAVNYEFKVLYALGILFIVAGHCGDSGEALVPFVSLFTLGSFQIALFVFASGYFYHSQNEQAVLKTIGKKILHLLVPYYLYSALYVGILYLTHAYGFTIGETPNGYNFFVMPWLNGHSYVYNLGGWFIFPLFEVEILVLLFRKCFSFVKDGLAKDIVFLLIGVTLGLLGNELTVLGYHEGYWLMLSRISYFLPFYAIGFFYHRYLEGKLRINWFLYFLVLSLLILAVCWYKGKVIYYTPSTCDNFDDCYTPLIIGLLGIFFWLGIAKILTPLLWKSKIVLLLSDNTYAIMINHLICFMAIKSIFYLISKTGNFCQGFDSDAFHTSVWYLYFPRKIYSMALIYLLAGLFIPALLHQGFSRLMAALSKQMKKSIRSCELTQGIDSK